MILSAPVTEKIRQALLKKDWGGIDTIVADSSRFKEKRARSSMQRTVNEVILDSAIQNNMPEILLAIRTIPPEGADDFFLMVLKQYIKTGNKKWFDILFVLSEKLGKKSLQSKIVARVVQELISEGITESDPSYIERGLAILNKITFRKYRSDCIVESAFKITRWTILSGNSKLLFQVRDLISGIKDVSKRAALHAEIAQALAAMAIKNGDFHLFLESIQFTAEIHQKLRRRDCLNHIISTGMRSSFGKDLLDARTLITHFEELPRDIQEELINSLAEQLLERVKNKNQIHDDFHFLNKKLPFIRDRLIQNLLKMAERSGDPWYLTTAVDFLKDNLSEEKSGVKDIVRTGITVARHTHSTQVLVNLIPFVEKACSRHETPAIYLQFSQIMLEMGDFDRATTLFSQIIPPYESSPQYCVCLAKLLEEGVSHDQGSLKFEEMLGNNNPAVISNAISQTIHQIGHVSRFGDIVKHNGSLKQLLTLHTGHDANIVDFITALTNRGFLDSCDSFILVDLAKLIQNPSVREQAISTVVMKLAEIGVRTGNRDFLQQAVGITCLIEGREIRSSTLSSIIDDAALLAATQGDLDLLLRMRIWSSSFLDTGLIAYAIKNIIEGVIKYATSKQDPDALDEAYRIAQDIEDPSLRIQMCERIAESFVKIGCDIIQDLTITRTNQIDTTILLKPFKRSLQLLKTEVKKPQVSLKIAGMIDIILFSSKKSTGRDFILPLALYSIEIEKPLERNAMMSRIIAKLSEDIVYPDSADPYEVLAYILQNCCRLKSNHETIDLIHRLLELTNDPFIRLRELCTLADSALRINDVVLCQKILDEVYLALSSLPAEYQKILILADLTTGFREIDMEKSRLCLQEGLDILRFVEPDQNTLVRRQLVSAIVRTGTLLPEKIRMDLILEIIENISDPIEYVTALISAYSLEREYRGENTLHHISEAIARIDSPYDRAILILKIVPLALQNGEDNFALDLLDKAEKLSKSINIQHVADSIRDEIAGILVDFSRRQGNSKYLKKSAEIITHIEDDYLRQYRLAQIGFEDAPEKSVPHTKIMAILTRIINNGGAPGQIMALEQTVRSITDRGKRALIYCRLSILSRDKADLKTAKRMLNNAIKESDIIRPLSKRAYIRCDIAIKMYTAGYESVAQDILDGAIDAATNIRQSILRDEVFNELRLAMRVMQGGGQE